MPLPPFRYTVNDAAAQLLNLPSLQIAERCPSETHRGVLPSYAAHPDDAEKVD
ncbi:hypothetical protein BS47DRAFT_1345644 [Hydnum rufescens UP504]|uniref:Uncharacterized protein n=1 Tax=Hydnum rufescens UP504 TaxID=1448309 RepID=A0A9P6DRJ1_9AGAM|nr:hypothetical protein BS47DRAFT_1345644 [Hydnum rufescens UP504]